MQFHRQQPARSKHRPARIVTPLCIDKSSKRTGNLPGGMLQTGHTPGQCGSGQQKAAVQAGLVGGEGFAVDASLIVADANKQRSIPGSEWNKARDPHGASRAMREYLATLDDAAFGAASEVMPLAKSAPITRSATRRRCLTAVPACSNQNAVRICPRAGSCAM